MKTVVISILGTTLDQRGKGKQRWNRWRPTISLCQHEDLLIDRLELIHDRQYKRLANEVAQDIVQISPETQVRQNTIAFPDPWDFESVYAALLDFARAYPFDPDNERYLIHITTGTHVAQICWYLLTEARYLPGKLLQTSPPQGRQSAEPGNYQIIDLDLSKYDQIASRFSKEHQEGVNYLKGGIETRNSAFNRMIEQLEKVSIRSTDPILITGPTGAGKSQLAERVYALKKQRGSLDGPLVTVNCATLRGDNAMSSLFGHKKGAFTGALSDRRGLLLEADKGLLFLDEIGELGLDEQAMLLRAIEHRHFMPFGADKEVKSDFQLIAGTNRDLQKMVQDGKFREDLLARINLWTYRLPSLKERIEDLPPNIDYELERYTRKAGSLISFNKDAREHYLTFSTSPAAYWSANFRDLNASITRMATLANGGRITLPEVRDEIERLQQRWQGQQAQESHERTLSGILSPQQIATMDLYDQIRLAGIVQVCRDAQSMADAGRRLFAVSRSQKKSHNDSHRIKQLLAGFDLSFEVVKGK